ncbi:MAG: putative baseplate assembly protein [Rhodothermales bacterium]
MSTNVDTRPCGCCEGIAPLTPASVENRPGLSALAYRVGIHPQFEQAMHVALGRQSVDDTRPLADLATRDNNDPALALIDGWATVLDVLTFYQERIANEHYLRTATERRSVLELARQIGYELDPGVAAGTVLAFALETALGAPGVARIPVGTRAQSVPGQDERPQTFETTEEIEGRAAWNAMRARTAEPYTPGMRARTLYLAGVTTNLRKGDALLLVGDERVGDPGNENWDVRRVNTLVLDRDRNLTIVGLDRPLGSVVPYVRPAAQPRVYALRTRAAVFGYNAPDWRAMPAEIKRVYPGTADGEWQGLTLSGIANDTEDADRTLYLDTAYPQIVPDSWVVVATKEYAEVYRVESAAEDARVGFALSGKSTRLVVDGEGLVEWFDDDVRKIVVFGQSEELAQTERPVTTDVRGDRVVLAERIERLEEGRLIAVTGFDATTGEPRAEIATLLRTEDTGDGVTRLVFEEALAFVYDRESVRLNANVARATHGEFRAEVLGSGDGSATFQRFELRDKPLTHVSAATPSGSASTLTVRIGGVRWDEVPTLYEQPPDAEVYVARRADDGRTTVQFGDGVDGARLPTGVENVTAEYRVGIGLDGLVDAGQISLLMTRPLGVRDVVNPLASDGADDPEVLGDARANAPLTVLTLDRVVSLQDFEDFARAFAGVGKAQAARLWSGEAPLVYLTVAGVEGAAVLATSELYANLRDAIDGARGSTERVEVVTYESLRFGVEAALILDERFVADDVLAAAAEAVRAAFAFERRAFGQGVTAGDVLAVLQRVDGVVAADLDRLGGANPVDEPRLLALPARVEGGVLRPAQLLTVDPDDIHLTERAT